MTAERRHPERRGQVVAAGDYGRLWTHDGAQWPVRVADRRDDTITLVLLVDPGELSDRGRGAWTLECTSRLGIAQFEGSVERHEQDVVRFRIAGEPAVVQRREYVRIQAPAPVRIGFAGNEEIGAAHSIDVSGGGMLLDGPDGLKLGDNIRFRLHIDPAGPPIKGRGRVVRCAGTGPRAVAFDDIAREDRERLIHFIFETQRAQRAKTRGDLF